MNRNKIRQHLTQYFYMARKIVLQNIYTTGHQAKVNSKSMRATIGKVDVWSTDKTQDEARREGCGQSQTGNTTAIRIAIEQS